MTLLTSVDDLLVTEIRDLYSAEIHLVKALPEMARAATDPMLKAVIEQHLEETRIHVQRLEKIADALDFSPKGRTCQAMNGLLEECDEVAEARGESSVLDLAIIVAVQKVEHYEISAYGSVRTLAESLGLDDVAEILQDSLDEEHATDVALTELSYNILPQVVEIAV